MQSRIIIKILTKDRDSFFSKGPSLLLFSINKDSGNLILVGDEKTNVEHPINFAIAINLNI